MAYDPDDFDREILDDRQMTPRSTSVDDHLVKPREWVEHDKVVRELHEAESEVRRIMGRRDRMWAKFLARGVQRRTIAKRADVADRTVSVAVQRVANGKGSHGTRGQ